MSLCNTFRGNGYLSKMCSSKDQAFFIVNDTIGKQYQIHFVSYYTMSECILTSFVNQ